MNRLSSLKDFILAVISDLYFEVSQFVLSDKCIVYQTEIAYRLMLAEMQ